MATETTCKISDDDIKAWWKAFINRDPNAPNTGLVKDDALFIYGVDERRAKSGNVQGDANLSSGKIKRIIGPAINTLAEEKDYAEGETKKATGPYAWVKKPRGGKKNWPLEPLYTHIGQSPLAGKEHSHGLWFCIPASEVESQDTIGFGGHGNDNFSTEAVWTVSK